MVTSLGSQAPLCLSALEEDYEKRAQLYKSVHRAKSEISYLSCGVDIRHFIDRFTPIL